MVRRLHLGRLHRLANGQMWLPILANVTSLTIRLQAGRVVHDGGVVDRAR